MNQMTPHPAAWSGKTPADQPALASAAGDHVRRSQATRIIHLCLLVVVLHQLIGSQFVEPPLPRQPPDWLYSLHEYIGLGGFGVVVIFWLWVVLRRGETRLGRLIPWFCGARRRALLDDLTAQVRRIMRGHPPDDADGALASAVHGLGALAVTAMAASGSIVFFAQGTPAGQLMLDLHRLLANFVWIYLFVHAGAAVLHHLLGSTILSRMFWFRQRRSAVSS